MDLFWDIDRFLATQFWEILNSAAAARNALALELAFGMLLPLGYRTDVDVRNKCADTRSVVGKS